MVPRFAVRSLSARLLLAIFGILGAVLTVYAFVSFRSAEEHFTEFVHADAQRSSVLIRRATHDAMLLNRQDDVQSTIERLAEGTTVAAIRIYDTEGRVVSSSRRSEIGQRRGLAEPCSICHRHGRRRRPAAAFAPGDPAAGASVLRHVSVIGNEPDCARSGCHPQPERQPILGVLDVQVSTRALDDALRGAKKQALWTMGALFLITGVVAAGFVQRVVHRPVLRLHDGTQRIARGDLDTRITVAGRHELAQLATAFNDMAADLQSARREARDWSSRLEEKVVEKTAELQRTQRQVLHMEKMASLGKLAATVAHELNNPLSSVLTYARLVERRLDQGALDDDAHAELDECLRMVQQECRRCGAIVQNLLLFAHPSGGTVMAAVDLNEVVKRGLMLTRHHLEMSNVKLHSEPLAGDPVIFADADQLEQALVALVVNAVEAMTGPGEGEGELRVTLAGDADAVTLSVADTGVGIHPEVLPHIFEPFFSTKNRESGVGLGLAVVYGIVQRHRGTIDVESEPGRGTVFHLRLPRRPAGAAATSAVF